MNRDAHIELSMLDGNGMGGLLVVVSREVGGIVFDYK